MCLPKSTRRTTILPRFMLTSVRMTTSLVSTPPVPPVKHAHRVSAVSVQSDPSVQNAMVAVVRRVAVSAMTSVRRVAPVRTNLCAKIMRR